MKKTLFVLLLTLLVVGAANAATSKAILAFTYAPCQLGDVELQTNNGNSVSTLTGWYDMGGNHTASNPDYIVGLAEAATPAMAAMTSSTTSSPSTCRQAPPVRCCRFIFPTLEPSPPDSPGSIATAAA